MSHESIRVLLADDHQLVIDGLKLMLAQEEDIVCVAEARNGQDAWQALKDRQGGASAKTEVDVAILDISMPEINGIELTRMICRDFPQTKVIGLSMIEEVSLIKSMLHHGALGFLPKNAGQDEVIDAIRKVSRSERYISASIAELLFDQMSRRRSNRVFSRFPALSRREKEILRLIIEEKTTTEIGEILFITPGTVETHRRNMLTKLGARNTAGLVRICVENRLLDD